MADGIRGLAQQEPELDLRRRGVIETPEEEALIAHMRGWCHNSLTCALCAVERHAFLLRQELQQVKVKAAHTQALLDSIIEG